MVHQLITHHLQGSMRELGYVMPRQVGLEMMKCFFLLLLVSLLSLFFFSPLSRDVLFSAPKYRHYVMESPWSLP